MREGPRDGEMGHDGTRPRGERRGSNQRGWVRGRDTQSRDGIRDAGAGLGPASGMQGWDWDAGAGLGPGLKPLLERLHHRGECSQLGHAGFDDRSNRPQPGSLGSRTRRCHRRAPARAANCDRGGRRGDQAGRLEPKELSLRGRGGGWGRCGTLGQPRRWGGR